MDQATGVVTSAMISGISAIIAAGVPPYLQSRKKREVVIRELQRGDYYQYSSWYMLLGISLPLACLLVLASYQFYGLYLGIITVVSRIPEQYLETIQLTADFTNNVDDVRKLLLIGLLLELVPMFVAILLTAKFVSHRFGPHKASICVGLDLIALIIIDLAFNFHFKSAAMPTGDIIRNSVIATIVYTIAATIGVLWARKTQPLFIIHCIYNRLSQPDREALSDLVRGVVEVPKNAQGQKGAPMHP